MGSRTCTPSQYVIAENCRRLSRVSDCPLRSIFGNFGKRRSRVLYNFWKLSERNGIDEIKHFVFTRICFVKLIGPFKRNTSISPILIFVWPQKNYLAIWLFWPFSKKSPKFHFFSFWNEAQHIFSCSFDLYAPKGKRPDSTTAFSEKNFARNEFTHAQCK